MPETQIITEFSISAIESLENYFRNAGSSLIRAAFAHTYFVHPDKVRERTPFFHDRARFSREHYPGLPKGSFSTWSGDGRSVRLDDNQYAQSAWEQYTGTRIARGSGYGLRHIWGHPWDLMHLPQAGTSAICPSGPACLLRDSTAIPIWNQQFAKHRGTCTSVTPPFAIRPILWRTQVSILSLYSKDSHFGSCVGNLLNAQHAPRRPNRRIPS